MTAIIFNYHLTVIIRHNLVLKPDTLQSFFLLSILLIFNSIVIYVA